MSILEGPVVVAFPTAPRPTSARVLAGAAGGQVLPLAMAFDRRRPGGAAAAARGNVRAGMAGKSCSCGHEKQAHQHYRRGTDCAFCSCAKFSRSILRRIIAGR